MRILKELLETLKNIEKLLLEIRKNQKQSEDRLVDAINSPHLVI